MDPNEAVKDDLEYATLGKAVNRACARLQGEYLQAGDTPSKHAARATLAILRKGAGQSLLSNPLLLEKVLMELEPGLHPAALGRGDEPSSAETAATATLCLFAWHMQSARAPVHDPKVSIAQACGTLLNKQKKSEPNENKSKSVKLRVDALLLTNMETSRLNHLRSIVSLLRSEGFAFNYGKLAEDLQKLNDPKQRPGVQLRWGRDLIRGIPKSTSSSTKTS